MANSRFAPGDDVVVTFDGQESPGEVIRAARGYVMCLIEPDPTWDYGGISSRLTPRTTVCVKETDVRYPE